MATVEFPRDADTSEGPTQLFEDIWKHNTQLSQLWSHSEGGSIWGWYTYNTHFPKTYNSVTIASKLTISGFQQLSKTNFLTIIKIKNNFLTIIKMKITF